MEIPWLWLPKPVSPCAPAGHRWVGVEECQLKALGVSWVVAELVSCLDHPLGEGQSQLSHAHGEGWGQLLQVPWGWAALL